MENYSIPESLREILRKFKNRPYLRLEIIDLCSALIVLFPSSQIEWKLEGDNVHVQLSTATTCVMLALLNNVYTITCDNNTSQYDTYKQVISRLCEILNVDNITKEDLFS